MTLLSSSEAAWRRSKVTLAVQHDVLRLQVSVDDALLVQVAQSHGDLRQVKTTHNTQHTTHNTRGRKPHQLTDTMCHHFTDQIFTDSHRRQWHQNINDPDGLHHRDSLIISHNSQHAHHKEQQPRLT